MTPSEIELLADQLRGEDALHRQAAANTLANLGPSAAGAAAALVEACGYEDTRESCASLLENLGPPPMDQLARLAELVLAGQLDVSYWAATLLGRAGEAAAAHVGQLEQSAIDSSRPLAARERAVWAIGKIGPAAGEAAASLRILRDNPTGPRIGRLAETALRSLEV